MGADLALLTIWTEGGTLDVDRGVAAVTEALSAESDSEALAAAADFTGCAPPHALAEAVISADPAADQAWRTAIAEGYRQRLEALAKGLRYSRDVVTIDLGPVVGYATGGFTWGDDPSETFTEWMEMFFQEEWRDWDTNPYAEVLRDAMLVRFENADTHSGKADQPSCSRVARISITSASDSASPLGCACPQM